MSTTRPTGKMRSPHKLDVSVVSPEEAEFGTAEFWAGDRLFGFTRLEDGELVLRNCRFAARAFPWRAVAIGGADGDAA